MKSGLDRISLGFFPTPLHELKNLNRILHGPEIYIKRDDYTGLALGGNKVRKLEYIMAEALNKGAQVIITTGAVTSNHARQTAGAAAALGLKCQLVLSGDEPETRQGNFLLDHLMGAETYCVRPEEVEAHIDLLVSQNAGQGQSTYVIPVGGSCMPGIISYVDAYQEIKEQNQLEFDAIVMAVGTGSTCAGLNVGARMAGDKTKIVGIGIGLGDREWCQMEIARLSNLAENFLGLEPSSPDQIIVFEEYMGKGYAIPDDRVRDTIKLLASKEAVILDPVYSAKAMVGLLDLIEKGYFKKGEKILFLATGGCPEIFGFNHFLSE
ncbi:putative pyridoxal phosphate-dependent deaminase [hydrocarbon metagenome]|uniref:Putative pyridoxal phosphate-dependent deaminase n=1 Tax=hydrocarbon metagenome TaxID=938273 RepID=A0A0W8E517_9ZZZZ